MRQNIPLEEAQHLLLERATCPGECELPLGEALGRIASREVMAAQSMPAFDRSPLDGYALRACDTLLAKPAQPVAFSVEEEIPAGHAAAKAVTSGTAAKVLTGAPIPHGADVVVKQEDVFADGNVIHVFHPLRARNNVVYIGENIKQGEVLARRGETVTAAVIGLLAEQGVKTLHVFAPIKAAIISTGDELVDLGATLTPGKIYDSNRHTLQARCKELGIDPVLLANVPDRREQIVARIKDGLAAADVVITTGGVSVGDYDIVREAVEALGASLLFWRVDIKPGSPMLAAVKDGKVIIGLSGNPVAALITFDLLAVPFLKKMMGCNKYFYSRLQGTLVNGFHKASEQRRFLRAKLLTESGRLWIKLMGMQNNSALKSMAECNLFVDIPAGSGALAAGETVLAHIVGKIDDVDG